MAHQISYHPQEFVHTTSILIECSIFFPSVNLICSEVINDAQKSKLFVTYVLFCVGGKEIEQSSYDHI